MKNNGYNPNENKEINKMIINTTTQDFDEDKKEKSKKHINIRKNNPPKKRNNKEDSISDKGNIYFKDDCLVVLDGNFLEKSIKSSDQSANESKKNDIFNINKKNRNKNSILFIKNNIKLKKKDKRDYKKENLNNSFNLKLKLNKSNSMDINKFKNKDIKSEIIDDKNKYSKKYKNKNRLFRANSNYLNTSSKLDSSNLLKENENMNKIEKKENLIFMI